MSEIVAILIVVAFIVVLQIWFFWKTRKQINQLSSFFPTEDDAYSKKDTSITKDVLESKTKLKGFISNPPDRYDSVPPVPVKTNTENKNEKGDTQTEVEVEHQDLSLIKIKDGNEAFKEVVDETNAYLCKNVGTSADFPILQDICERKIESLENQISNTINTPLYIGLAGTFVGVIVGLFGIHSNVDTLFSADNMSPLKSLLISVVIAMGASLIGLVLMTFNSSWSYKNAIQECEKHKNEYYDFLRRELMPTLSNSMASSLNSLKGVLGEFIGKFGKNLDAYSNSAELLNDNIEKQHLLLVEVNKMKQKEVAVEIAKTYKDIRESAESLTMFRTYQDDLNDTIHKVKSTVGEIDGIMKSFKGFTAALEVVVKNQACATELQSQFRTAIEKHFPLGSDTREMYRKQFDELTTDARVVSSELNQQLRASTEYIKSFTEDNKTAFSSFSRLNDVLNKLIEYADVQATCYKDLKQEISNLKQEQIKTQQNAAQLNTDLLKAVQAMIAAIKSMKE